VNLIIYYSIIFILFGVIEKQDPTYVLLNFFVNIKNVNWITCMVGFVFFICLAVPIVYKWFMLTRVNFELNLSHR
jgi:hypothetical protein